VWTLAQERLSEIRHEAMPLLLRHWGEIALNQATTPLDPDWEAYRRLEDAGVLHVTTLRVDGELIGYVSFLVAPNLHYRTVVVATDDVFFLLPEGLSWPDPTKGSAYGRHFGRCHQDRASA
jgi:hypothetical protein